MNTKMLWSQLTVLSLLFGLLGVLSVTAVIDKAAGFCKNPDQPRIQYERFSNSALSPELLDDAVQGMYAHFDDDDASRHKGANVTDYTRKDVTSHAWRPNCRTPHAVCVTLLNGIRRIGGQTPDWRLQTPRSSPVELFWYFNKPTVLFTGDGGNASYHPAHGCIDVCVKGTMMAYFVNQRITLRGQPKHPDKLWCFSATKDLNDDVILALNT